MTNQQLIDNCLLHAFAHIYPHDTFDIIRSHDDECITVTPSDDLNVPMRTMLDSDDDGFMYFTPFDPDADPIDDDRNFICVRIQMPTLLDE